MSRTKQRARKSSGKRKRDGDDGSDRNEKRQQTTRPEQTKFDESVSMMGPSLISDHFAKALQKHSSNSTSIELEDQYIPSRSLRDTTSFSKPRLAKHLPEFLESFSDGREELLKGDLAAPNTLIITSSGIRAADLARELRVFAKDDIKVAKLFAKHMKLAETVKFLGSSKISMGVGSPSRPKELVTQGALKVDKIKRIVIDASYIDDKQRTIFDLGEIFLPLVDLLNIGEIKSRLDVEDNAIEILVF